MPTVEQFLAELDRWQREGDHFPTPHSLYTGEYRLTDDELTFGDVLSGLLEPWQSGAPRSVEDLDDEEATERWVAYTTTENGVDSHFKFDVPRDETHDVALAVAEEIVAKTNRHVDAPVKLTGVDLN